MLPKILKSLNKVPGRPKFLKTHILKPLLRFCYIDDIFLIWTHGEEKLKKFMKNFNSVSNDELDKENIFILDLKVISISF